MATCQHTKTKVLYDQGNKSEGRKLRGVADRCVSCGHIAARPSVSEAEPRPIDGRTKSEPYNTRNDWTRKKPSAPEGGAR